jgi:hypothetical protein
MIVVMYKAPKLVFYGLIPLKCILRVLTSQFESGIHLLRSGVLLGRRAEGGNLKLLGINGGRTPLGVDETLHGLSTRIRVFSTDNGAAVRNEERNALLAQENIDRRVTEPGTGSSIAERRGIIREDESARRRRGGDVVSGAGAVVGSLALHEGNHLICTVDNVSPGLRTAVEHRFEVSRSGIIGARVEGHEAGRAERLREENDERSDFSLIAGQSEKFSDVGKINAEDWVFGPLSV